MGFNLRPVVAAGGEGGRPLAAKSDSLPSHGVGGGGDSKSLTLPEWCQRATFGVLELAC